MFTETIVTGKFSTYAGALLGKQWETNVFDPAATEKLAAQIKRSGIIRKNLDDAIKAAGKLALATRQTWYIHELSDGRYSIADHDGAAAGIVFYQITSTFRSDLSKTSIVCMISENRAIAWPADYLDMLAYGDQFTQVH